MTSQSPSKLSRRSWWGASKGGDILGRPLSYSKVHLVDYLVNELLESTNCVNHHTTTSSPMRCSVFFSAHFALTLDREHSGGTLILKLLDCVGYAALRHMSGLTKSTESAERIPKAKDSR